MFDRWKLPIIGGLPHCDKKCFSKEFFVQNGNTSDTKCWTIFTTCIFCTFDEGPLYFPLDVSIFLIFSPRASHSKWVCLKTGGRKTRDARLAQKHKKPSLTKMWDKGGSTFNPKEKVLAVHVTFHFCEVSSQKSLFILNKDVNDLEGEHLAELFTSKNCCSKFFKGHLGQKERRGEKKEEIRTNLSILILVHFSKGARRDEFFWGLGIKLWTLSVSFRPLSLTWPKSSLDTWQFGSLNYLNSDIYLFIWLSKLCTW